MAAQFLLNLFITLLWVLLKDEEVLKIQTVVTGFIIGSFIVFLMRRFFGGHYYLHRVLSIIKLIFIFISEILQSSVVVIKHILSPKINIEPGIFTYKTILHGDWEVTTLALLLMFTLVSLVMEVNDVVKVFYIYLIDLEYFEDNL